MKGYAVSRVTTRVEENTMPDAFIYDHVRTPRGRGKADGALHEVTALNLATQALAVLRERNKLDPTLVGRRRCSAGVDPVGGRRRQSRARRRSRRAMATRCRGCRSTAFCASGLDAVNFAAAQVMSGQHGHDDRRRHRIHESDRQSAPPAAAWPVDPAIALKVLFHCRRGFPPT